MTSRATADYLALRRRRDVNGGDAGDRRFFFVIRIPGSGVAQNGHRSNRSEFANPAYNPAMDLRLNCPGCDEAVDIPTESAGLLVRCPYCNTDFFASEEHSHLAVVDDTAPPVEGALPDEVFNRNRIAMLAALRRGAIRTRGLWILSLGIGIVGTLDGVRRAAIYVLVLHHWGIWPTIDVVVSLLALRGAFYCRFRARQLKLEIDHSAIPEPTTPPDFTTLSDGSNRWKDLENIR
jgi:hypothetical protein